MKVIKHGALVVQKTCPDCKCIFEYDGEDIKNLDFDSYGYKTEYTIICPECKNRIRLYLPDMKRAFERAFEREEKNNE